MGGYRAHEKDFVAGVAIGKKYKGSWSGEHGDGLARSPYNEEFLAINCTEHFKR